MLICLDHPCRVTDEGEFLLPDNSSNSHDVVIIIASIIVTMLVIMTVKGYQKVHNSSFKTITLYAYIQCVVTHVILLI